MLFPINLGRVTSPSPNNLKPDILSGKQSRHFSIFPAANDNPANSPPRLDWRYLALMHSTMFGHNPYQHKHLITTINYQPYQQRKSFELCIFLMSLSPLTSTDEKTKRPSFAHLTSSHKVNDSSCFCFTATTFLKLTPSNVPSFSTCFFFASSLHLFLTMLPSLQKMNVLSCYTVCV